MILPRLPVSSQTKWKRGAVGMIFLEIGYPANWSQETLNAAATAAYLKPNATWRGVVIVLEIPPPGSTIELVRQARRPSSRPQKPNSDVPLIINAPYLMVEHKRFGTVFRRRRLLAVSDCAENDNEPKTNVRRNRKCAKTKTPKAN